MNLTPETLEDLLRDVIYVAEKAASESLKLFSERQSLIEKSPGDWSSLADAYIEHLLQEDLSRILPQAKFIGEEGGSKGQGEMIWLVDPIDGSANFVRGIPHFATVVSLLCSDGDVSETLAAVTVDACRRETYTTTKFGQTLCNGQVQRVSSHAQQQSLLAAVTPKPNSEATSPFFAWLQRPLSTFGGFRRSGAMALDLAWLAAGRLDAFAGLNLADWDVTAGELHVRQAGGMVQRIHSDKTPTQIWFFASNGPDNMEALKNVY